MSGWLLAWHLRLHTTQPIAHTPLALLFGAHLLVWALGLALPAMGFLLWRQHTRRLTQSVADSLRAEQSLRASEERLRLTLEATQDGLYELNFGHGPDLLSDRMFTMLGYPPRHGEGGYEFLRGLLHPADEAAFQQAVDALWTGRSDTIQLEARLRAADGVWHTIMNRGRCVARSADGAPLRLLGTHTDISELKRVSRQLELHSAALAATANAIVITDAAGTIQWVNPAFTRLTGYSAAEAIGQNPRILKSGVNSERFYQKLWETIQGGRVWHNEEVVNRRKDGSLYSEQMTITPVKDETGAITNFIAVKLDISERKQAEEELHAQRDFARQVMDSMGEGLAVLDKTDAFEYVNPALAHLLGYDHAALVGQPYAVILAADESDQASASSAEPRRYEITLRHAAGQMVSMRVTDVPRPEAARLDIPHAEGARGGRILVFTDLTKHKAIEAELASARDRAIEASRLKSEFLANMSHEIRTPLNGIIGMTGLILGTQLGADQREFAETIRTSSDSLLSIINEILDFSKIEAGRLELEERPFGLRACIEEALDLLTPKALDGGLELIYYIDPRVPEVVLGDETRLRQILVNLLGNAVKFTPSGDVYVSVRPDEQAEGLLEFAVRDTGIGIPADRLLSLFRPFMQVDASTTRRFGGTGLGLTISKRLAEMMGGRMWAESQLGMGSTFRFTLVLPAALPSTLQPARDLAPLAGKRLLIVDDDATSRAILERYATDLGMVYAGFAGSEQALAHLVAAGAAEGVDADGTAAPFAAPFDIALLDMYMPGMDGIALATALHQLPLYRRLPVVLLAAVGKPSRHNLPLMHATQLTKPVKADQLAGLLLEILHPAPGAAGIPAADAVSAGSERLGDRYPLRILLAEDNLVNQKVALRMLERLGYAPNLASNGNQALDALARQPYDVVLMDVQMPELDGIEATRRIRQDSRLEQPYIIAMTAHAMEGDREHCLRNGMNDYISKPVRLESLSFVLQRVYEERQNPAALFKD